MLFGAVMMVLSGGCSVNILETFADKNSNEALYVDAVTLINSADYSGALTKIALMTPPFSETAAVHELKASAYGGICGFTFISFVQAIQANTGRLMPFLVNQFKGATSAKISACINAEAEITGLGTVTERTDDQNAFLVLSSLAKVGTILSYYTDSDQDGTADQGGGEDVCQNNLGARPGVPVKGNWYDSDLRQVGSGLTLAVEALTQLGTKVDFSGASMASVTTACGSLAVGGNFCAVTNPASFTATQVKGIQSLIKESSTIGLSINCVGDVTTCNCP